MAQPHRRQGIDAHCKREKSREARWEAKREARYEATSQTTQGAKIHGYGGEANSSYSAR